MDAHAYLTSQGWRGSGHSLHASSDAIGLSRPILVSQKQNVLGVGKKQHRTSDMWWMNAFDKSLKGLDTTKEGTVVQTITSGALDMVAKGGSKWAGKGGLYSCFVKGETLVGSVEEFRLLKEGNKMIVNETEVKVAKRKREMETKEERRWRKMEKRTKRAAKAAKKDEKAAKKVAKKDSSSSSTSADRVESKAERKARKEAKRAKKAIKAAKDLLKIERAAAGEKTNEQRKDRKRVKELAKKSENSDTLKSDSKKANKSQS